MDDNKDNLNEIRNRQANILLVTLSFTSSIVLAASIYRTTITGWQPLFALHIVSYISLIFITLIRNRLSLTGKSLFSIIIFLFLGLGALITWGLAGFGIPFLILSVIFSTTFLGYKEGVVVACISAIIIASIGICISTGLLTFNYDIRIYAYAKWTWVTNFVAYIFIAMIVVVIMGNLGQILAQKMAKVNQQRKEIETAHKKLKQEIISREQAESQMKILRGMLPICSSCKKIRDDAGYWRDVTAYIEDYSEAEFTHGICPECSEKLYPEFQDKP